jgi:hypothetical protein
MENEKVSKADGSTALRGFSYLVLVLFGGVYGYNIISDILRSNVFNLFQSIYIVTIFVIGTIVLSVSIVNLIFKIFTHESFQFRRKQHNRKTS